MSVCSSKDLTEYIKSLVVSEITKLPKEDFGAAMEDIERVDFLKPTRPEDGIFGFIAYDGPKGNRVKLRTARYLTRKLKLTEFLSDTAIRDIAVRIEEHIWDDEERCQVEILRGEDIVKAYKDEVGGHSCMSGHRSHCVKMYANNPDKFGLLVVRSGNDSLRAVIIKADNGETYVSRYYCTAEWLRDVADSYAKKEGWKLNEPPIGEMVSSVKFDYGHVPYMDIFEYAVPEGGGYITLYSDEEGATLSLNNTDGHFSERCERCGDFEQLVANTEVCESCFDELYTRCYACEEVVSYEDAVEDDCGDMYCPECYEETYTKCEICGQETEREDMKKCEDMAICKDCYDTETVECDECGEVYFESSIIEIETLDLCPDCYRLAEACEICGKEYLSDDLREINGKIVCEDCEAEILEETAC
ncbi:MAG: hypothetical protein JRI56_00115 [Deltaproteobacteria bacterium]|nr:hypothetical protein [Deltaproteobacteria bacterium]